MWKKECLSALEKASCGPKNVHSQLLGNMKGQGDILVLQGQACSLGDLGLNLAAPSNQPCDLRQVT